MTEAIFAPKRKPGYYYASSLNLFVNESCSKQMDCINVDCLMVKVEKKRIRFIESKHRYEQVANSQSRVYGILNTIFKAIPESKYQIEFCVVRGNYPYNEAEVSFFDSDKKYTLTGDQLRDWLDFKIELSAITPDPKEAIP